MADEPNPRRKTRTRGHVIADLGVNYVERQVLLAGYVVERYRFDYGLDLWLQTFTPDGVADNGHAELQVKATDKLAVRAGGTTAAVRVEAADVRGWLLAPVPVFLTLYDAAADRAFWLDVQEYVRQQQLDEDEFGRTVTLRMPLAQVWTPAAVHALRAPTVAAAARQVRGGRGGER
ncbi:MAG: DUF4365 domain-containing protein [Gemmataceae bacterium]|nr:DUF4365 domain-containing protein [Gemmataceae bacterium]